VKKGAIARHVRIDIGGQTVTASITNEAARRVAARLRACRFCDQGTERAGGVEGQLHCNYNLDYILHPCHKIRILAH